MVRHKHGRNAKHRRNFYNIVGSRAVNKNFCWGKRGLGCVKIAKWIKWNANQFSTNIFIILIVCSLEKQSSRQNLQVYKILYLFSIWNSMYTIPFLIDWIKGVSSLFLWFLSFRLKQSKSSVIKNSYILHVNVLKLFVLILIQSLLMMYHESK